MLRAPRQTGKTSALIALRDLLNSGAIGDFRCVDVNVKVGQVVRNDVQEGMCAILSSLAMSAEFGRRPRGGRVAGHCGKSGPNNAWRHTVASFPPQRSALGSHAMGVSSPASAAMAHPLGRDRVGRTLGDLRPLTTGVSSSRRRRQPESPCPE